MYRLSRSPYQNQFILKGALLFFLWSNQTHRPTRDLDLLGYGESTVSSLEEIFREICQIPVEPDGLEFKHEQAIGSPIKEKQEYEGVRIKLPAFLSGTRTRINLQIDIGFGDAVTPRAMEVEFPTIQSVILHSCLSCLMISITPGNLQSHPRFFAYSLNTGLRKN